MATPIPRNEASWSLSEVTDITRGRLIGGQDTVIHGVCTDTRALVRGNLFVALKGASFDGHNYLSAAAAAGAHALLVRRGSTIPQGATVVEVDDTLTALGDLAQAHRRRWGGYVVGITGSVGKTLVKELAAPVLQAMYRHVLHSQGNLNNLIGLPMTLFQLRPEHRIAVVELGISQAGEMASLAAIAKPDAALITRIAMAHTEGLGGLTELAEQKAQLLTALSSKGLAVLNADDAMTPTLLKHVTTPRVMTFGRHPEADVQLIEQHIDSDLRCGSTLEIKELSAEPLRLHMRALGEGVSMASAAVIALVVGMLKVSQPGSMVNALRAASRVLNELPALPQRLQLKRGANDSLIIDDTYNANPASVTMGLDTAAEIARVLGGRLLVVLGDMKELGPASRDEHRQIGRYVVDKSATVFIGCGREMLHAVEAASETTSLSSPTSGFHVSEPGQAIAQVLQYLQPRDVVFVKGSRSMRMEYVVQGLLAPLEAA
ncbi:MAG: UDP-N-acetylmuramoyl-tripeptide--D-alanyl-D-alanine ligase [Myxococcales bacterium]|nr:UDP-N-acetylmuramoyl-tripeptide--D-alanyl-D-alanine ligase [Myxococcales bacterium]